MRARVVLVASLLILVISTSILAQSPSPDATTVGEASGNDVGIDFLLLLVGAFIGAMFAFGFQWWLVRWQRGLDAQGAARVVYSEVMNNVVQTLARQSVGRPGSKHDYDALTGAISDSAYLAYADRLAMAIPFQDMQRVTQFYGVLTATKSIAEAGGLNVGEYERLANDALGPLAAVGWPSGDGPSGSRISASSLMDEHRRPTSVAD